MVFWIGNTHDDGTVMNFAKRLQRVDVEVYTRSKVERRNPRGEIQLWPQFPYVRTDTSAFNWYRHGRHYSSHIGEIELPEINYDTPNYGSFHGFIMHHGELVTGYNLRIGAFGTGSPHLRTNTGHPMWGFGVFGNVERGRYYASAPMLPGPYNLNLSLTSPEGRTAHRRAFVDANRPNVPVTIRVEHFFPDGDHEVDALAPDDTASELVNQLENEASSSGPPKLFDTKQSNETLFF